jgi:hypothetical protein
MSQLLFHKPFKHPIRMAQPHYDNLMASLIAIGAEADDRTGRRPGQAQGDRQPDRGIADGPLT